MMSNENDIVNKVNDYRESLKECLEGTNPIDKPKLIRLLQTLYRIDISRTLLEVSLLKKNGECSMRVYCNEHHDDDYGRNAPREVPIRRHVMNFFFLLDDTNRDYSW